MLPKERHRLRILLEKVILEFSCPSSSTCYSVASLDQFMFKVLIVIECAVMGREYHNLRSHSGSISLCPNTVFWEQSFAPSLCHFPGGEICRCPNCQVVGHVCSLSMLSEHNFLGEDSPSCAPSLPLGGGQFPTCSEKMLRQYWMRTWYRRQFERSEKFVFSCPISHTLTHIVGWL